jgi:predicted RNA-binding Zn-ribbon protein involved in translation (DUF1610 family)
MRSNREKDLENIINEMYTHKIEAPADNTVGEAEATDTDTEDDGVGSNVSGDPSTWQVGQIVPSSVSKDDYDGIIINIGEEDGERTFDLMQVGPEGWSVPESDLNLPDDDTGRVPSDALAGSKHDYKSDPIPGMGESTETDDDTVDETSCNTKREGASDSDKFECPKCGELIQAGHCNK